MNELLITEAVLEIANKAMDIIAYDNPNDHLALSIACMLPIYFVQNGHDIDRKCHQFLNNFVVDTDDRRRLKEKVQYLLSLL